MADFGPPGPAQLYKQNPGLRLLRWMMVGVCAAIGQTWQQNKKMLDGAERDVSAESTNTAAPAAKTEQPPQ